MLVAIVGFILLAAVFTLGAAIIRIFITFFFGDTVSYLKAVSISLIVISIIAVSGAVHSYIECGNIFFCNKY